MLLVKQSHLDDMALLVKFVQKFIAVMSVLLTHSAIHPSIRYWSELLTAMSLFFRSYDPVAQDSRLIVSSLMEELFSFFLSLSLI